MIQTLDRKLNLKTLSIDDFDLLFFLRDRGQSADSSIVMLTGSSGYDIPTQEVFEAVPGMVNNAKSSFSPRAVVSWSVASFPLDDVLK